MRKHAKTGIFWLVILVLVILLVINPPWREPPKEQQFSWFLGQVEKDYVDSVKIFNRDQKIEGVLRSKEKFKTAFPAGFDIVKELRKEKDVKLSLIHISEPTR